MKYLIAKEDKISKYNKIYNITQGKVYNILYISYFDGIETHYLESGINFNPLNDKFQIYIINDIGKKISLDSNYFNTYEQFINIRRDRIKIILN